ncbi:MAG: hypothetical protein DI527_00740 [Chelatococcus sp.]|nr:MAG: hypothetical protein DI527_00740 [Chelatococcus sp.]
MEKKPYIVTEEADAFTKIAGKYRALGASVMLTDQEAEWEEKRGLIVPGPKAPDPATKKKS